MAAAVIGQGRPAPAQRSMGLRSVGQPIGSGIGLSWLLAGAGGFGALGVSRRPKRRWIRRSGGVPTSSLCQAGSWWLGRGGSGPGWRRRGRRRPERCPIVWCRDLPQARTRGNAIITSMAAEVMIRPERMQAGGNGVVAVAGFVVAFLDPGQQEHLVVHGQAEREHENHDGASHCDGAEGLEAE